MILQPDSPMRQPRHIREAVELAAASGADSVVGVSAVPAHYNPMRTLRVDERGFATLLVTGEPVRTRINRRQDMPEAWTMNGAIYLFRTSLLFSEPPTLYGDRVAAYRMDGASGLSIETLEDLAEAERAIELLATRRG